MPVITEGMLRKLDKEGQLEKVRITEKDILTPSAREFLNVKKIDFRIKKSQDQVVNDDRRWKKSLPGERRSAHQSYRVELRFRR